MRIPFSPWPESAASEYRDKGYWTGETIHSLLASRAKTTPDAIAIVCGKRRINYAEFYSLVNRLSIAFAKKRLGPKDTAVIHLTNTFEFYLAFFALLKRGVTPVLALAAHRYSELSHYLSQTNAKLLISDGDIWGKQCSEMMQRLQAEHSDLAQIVMTNSLQDMPDFVTDFNSLTSEDDSIHGDLGLPNEVAFFQLSGGSTGTPKLIPRTHDDYLYSVRESSKICQLNEQSRYLCALPVGHNFSLSSPGALGIFYAGGTVVLAKDPSPDTCFSIIEAEKINITALVPPVAMVWMKSAERNAKSLASLKLLQVGGAKFSQEAAKKVEPLLGCKLQQVFGMAEGLVNYTRIDDSSEIIENTQGRPISDDDEILVLDDNDEPVARGEIGHLLTRGPYTFRGYFQAPVTNSKSFTADGFYRTGDIVRQTADGYLIVEGRHKDQINRGGEKIAAEEIENHLIAFDGVLDVALVAMPDELMGEKSCAFLIPEDVNIPVIKLRQFLRQRGLADYKIPDRFEFVPVFPKTAVGKVSKKQLRLQIIDILKGSHKLSLQSFTDSAVSK
ncbi:(2,3-dihydroxybenzoyl)adenylate synthase [Aliikangiella coralliicola]|uniref:(2,3-dihydroxybenzoyl)adenylate synthase n=1 Tax=Aliikangiella coralliicola TaxID=2592383 RepID=A0A545UCB9_9GAMM|nr:(2,3-dihydroxybenzoyl)adenylate synthase [Aliikangiella coralliicola]TQV87110.1 (2,3-dihydroxybenzoyl)adenylate synthase [Aliikangiella coralliicola]